MTQTTLVSPFDPDEYDELEVLYTCGHCWLLAWALARVTGGEMLAVSQTQCPNCTHPDDRGLEWNHVVVAHPNDPDRVIDFYGWQDAQDALDHWSEGFDLGACGCAQPELIPVPESRMAELLGWSPDEMGSEVVREALSHARALLAAYPA